MPELWVLTIAGLHVPLIPLSDTKGNDGTYPPAQIVSDVPKLKVGVTVGITVTDSVTVFAHGSVGVNVYVLELLLSITDGPHVPASPFVEVPGNEGAVVPEQILMDVPKLNVGVITGFTVTVNVVEDVHEPDVGVNVYTPETLLLTNEGLHVPLIPFDDVPGKFGTEPPAQIFNNVPKAKVGMMTGFTVTVNVAGVAH